MKFELKITKSARDDLINIYKSVFKNDSASRADTLYEKFKSAILELDQFPYRGHVPPELDRINITGYLEIHYKPYRIVYQVFDNKIFIHCVLDSRRNLSEILQNRLIR
jgi:toxin ParE1/3/4